MGLKALCLGVRVVLVLRVDCELRCVLGYIMLVADTSKDVGGVAG